MKTLKIKCGSFHQAMNLPMNLVGDDVSFSYDAETGNFSVQCETKAKAQDIIDRIRLSKIERDHPGYKVTFFYNNQTLDIWGNPIEQNN